MIKHKFKHQCPSPEELYTDRLYAISFNPEEQPTFERFYKMKLNNLSDWSNTMKNIFQLKYCTTDMILEISQKGRFHYHGYLMINDIARFVINDLAKLRHYGTYEIDSISEHDDGDSWRKYCYKQQRFMQPYAERNDMEYHIITE